jgi:kynureninase
MQHILTREFALEADANDPLKDYRTKFQLDDPHLIYLDGNSLGVLPRETVGKVNHVVEYEWGQRLIRSWNEGWYHRAEEIASKIAGIIGAREDEVIVADSTSVNFFKLAWAALKIKGERKGILSDTLNFPSDIYLLQGLADMVGSSHNIKLAESDDGIGMNLSALEKLVNEDTALLTLSHVTFKSAFRYDMKQVTRLAHEKGALVLWDLSHSVGAVPVKLNNCNADMAVGCTYKYLNGGPGAPAFLYVRRDLQEKLQSPIWGWFGADNPFAFGLQYAPAQGIRKFLAGTPPVLSLSALDTSLDLISSAGIDKIHSKSKDQGQCLIRLFYHFLKPLGYSLGSPKDPEMRGSHVSLRHKEGYRICKALIDPDIGGKTIIPDFREPDNIRLGITPLYTTYNDLYETVMQLKAIVEGEWFKKFSDERDMVT